MGTIFVDFDNSPRNDLLDDVDARQRLAARDFISVDTGDGNVRLFTQFPQILSEVSSRDDLDATFYRKSVCTVHNLLKSTNGVLGNLAAYFPPHHSGKRIVHELGALVAKPIEDGISFFSRHCGGVARWPNRTGQRSTNPEKALSEKVLSECVKYGHNITVIQLTLQFS